MEQVQGWVPGDVPPDEWYWEALLREEESGQRTRITAQMPRWDSPPPGEGEGPEGADTATEGEKDDPWDDARRAMESGERVELPVVGCNRGGVLVGWNGLRGFVPASHLTNISPHADEEEREQELRRLVGSSLRLKVIELNPTQRRFVLSERATRSDEVRRQDLLDSLCPGDISQGHVTNLCSFGAFVDLGGLEGLVHVSELSWGRVEHPRDVLEPGQPVEVYILNIDRDRQRVGLSIKRLQPDPWQFVDEHYHVGEMIEGVITQVVDFGAFVRVEEGLEGLIHVSELAEGSFVHPRDVVREGETVRVRVLNVNRERRRMGLSLRQAGESTLV